ncbi:MAG: hypothetical protein D6722_10385 [Bacteroidetes bacterium]|nr:MAG: hypothetical protein D6722_10385 [Bacteroidota bacterium]
MEITYERIAPLIVEAEAEGSRMFVTFQVPGTNEVVEAQATIRRSNSIQSTVTRAVKRQAAREIRRTTSRLLRQALGSGFLGRTARTIVNTSTRNNDLARGFSEEEKRNAIMEAFQQVADHFQFDDRQESWRPPAVPPAPKAMGAFEQRVHKHPIDNRYDQEVLARMLIELSEADGHMGDEERDFLESFLPAEIGGVEAFVNSPALSAIECEEVTEAVKPAIYMIARALSLIDFEADSREDDMLREFAHMLGLGETEVAELDQHARLFVLEQAIDMHTPRDLLFSYASKLGMSEDEALRAQIQLKKRQ